MHGSASPLPLPASPGGNAAPPDVLEAAVRVAMAMLGPRTVSTRPQGACPLPMLTVKQTAALMGMSRMTVIRKADAGELPCVVVSRGARQTMRRFPRAAIEELAARGGGSAQVDLKEYTAQWLASALSPPDPPCRDVAARRGGPRPAGS